MARLEVRAGLGNGGTGRGLGEDDFPEEVVAVDLHTIALHTDREHRRHIVRQWVQDIVNDCIDGPYR